MRSAKDCLAKAIDMEQRAKSCTAAERAELLAMAHTWRNIAQQALWTPRLEARPGDRQHHSPSRSWCSTRTAFPLRSGRQPVLLRHLQGRAAADRAACSTTLGDGQWDIPALRVLLETIIPERVAMDGFEVEHDFPGIGQRIMLLNARKVLYENSPTITILLAFTRRHRAPVRSSARRQTCWSRPRSCCARSRRAAAGDAAPRRQQPADHRQHPDAEGPGRILRGNPLSPQGRASAGDVGRRGAVASARVEGIDQIEVGAYLTKLCASLAASMVGESSPIAVEVAAPITA
jgi:hypothetical protein